MLQTLKRKYKWLILLVVAGVVVLMIAPPHAQAYMFVSKQWEINQKQAVWNAQVKRLGISQNMIAKQRLKRITNQLLAVLSDNDRTSWPWTFTVTAEKEWNAFDTLGATVFVSESLINAASDDELALVLAHEMTHQTQEHVLHSIDAAYKAQMIGTLLLGNSGSQTAAYVIDRITGQVLVKGYGGEHEREADRMGFARAVQAGYNPAAGAVMFHKFFKKFGDGQSAGVIGVLIAWENPDPHDSNRQRIDEQLQYLTDYSGGKVTVNQTTVQLQGVNIVAPVRTVDMDEYERAYWLAGNLARILHVNPTAQTIEIRNPDTEPSLYLDNQLLMVCSSADESPSVIRDRLQQALQMKYSLLPPKATAEDNVMTGSAAITP